MRRYLTLFLALIAAAPLQLAAENYNETQKWWFFNTETPNWTCTDTRVACYEPGPNNYTFSGLYFVRRSPTVYVYVQGHGPMPSGGDNFTVWTIPDSAPGWTGTQGLTLVNAWPRPDDAWFWQLRSAFYDSSLAKTYVVASRTISGNSATIDVMDAKLGTSSDNVNFTWSTLMTSRKSILGIRLEDYVLTPHPSQLRVWVGTITWFLDSGPSRVSPWKVDWNTGLIHIPNSSGVWQTIPIGGTLSFVPFVIDDQRVTNIQSVYVGSGSRLEAWGTRVVSYTQGSGVQNNPCPPGYPNGVATETYLTNRSDPQQVGSASVFYRIFDPNTLTFTTPWTQITSAVRALPSDYLHAVTWMASRFDPGGREYVYTGSKDIVICNRRLTWNPWSGSGVLVTKVDYVP